MRHIPGLLVSVLAISTLTARSATAPIPPDAVPAEALKAVTAALPKGWSASVKGATLTIRREKKIGLVNVVGEPWSYVGDVKTRRPQFVEPYEITLQFRPRLTAVQYERQRKENVAIEAKLDAMRDRLRAAQITHKFDDWLPDTEEQKKLVAEYRKAQKAMPYHRLPDFYTENNSIDREDSLLIPLSFADEDVAKECMTVKKTIEGLFKPYEMK